LAALAGVAQTPAATPQATPAPDVAPAGSIAVPAGTRIPLTLINRISTKNAHEGDQVYLQSAFPVVINNSIIIPPGSYVKGTITSAKRPGRVAGKGELYLRFDSLTLPNGVTRDFKARVGAIDGSNADTLDKKEGKIVSDPAKGHDVATVAETTAVGTSIGAIATRSSPGVGAGIGAGAGLLAGLATVLLTRGPDAVLERGSTVDMVLDRELYFTPADLNFARGIPAPVITPSNGTGPQDHVINPAHAPLPLPGGVIPRP
jgi:type IV secretion system protein VirB10